MKDNYRTILGRTISTVFFLIKILVTCGHRMLFRSTYVLMEHGFITTQHDFVKTLIYFLQLALAHTNSSVQNLKITYMVFFYKKK